jgi:type VI secretion system protein ImpL
VGSVLDRLVEAPGRAPDVAARVLTEGGKLRAALQTIRSELRMLDRGVRTPLFDAPVRAAWRQILSAAQAQLNERWQRTVYRSYQEHLEGRYPFASSPQGAALAAVERFFRPEDGTVARFEAEALDPFLQADRRVPKTWAGHGIQLSPATKRFLNAADRIRSALFAGGALRLQLRLTPDIPKRGPEAPSPSRVHLQLHGTAQTYRMGYRPTTTVGWPGGRGARLLLSTRDGTLGPKQFDGAWALFRLLSEAEVAPQAQNRYRVRWRFRREGRYRLVALYTLRATAPTRLLASPQRFFRLRVPSTID